MSSWNCASCGEVIDFGFETCWNCGAQQDGSSPSVAVVVDDLPAVDDAIQPRTLDCLRCQSPMLAVGRKKLHDGPPVQGLLLGNLGELFTNREIFDVYSCTGCGKVELFLTQPAG